MKNPTPDILAQIIAERRADAAAAADKVPVSELLPVIAKRRHHSLMARLRSSATPRIIAEIKKASPSAGILQEPYHPADIAREYESAGAVGISVLTEPRHFLGSSDDLRAVRAAVALPILRKDFICDPYQIYEAAAWGADAVLLIVATLNSKALLSLYKRATELGLETIVEAHSPGEVNVALGCENAIIGVNSRNLKTLKTDLAVARKLAPLIPADRLSIAESGIKTRADILALQQCGYKGFLVGESLLKHGTPGGNLKGLLGWTQGKP